MLRTLQFGDGMGNPAVAITWSTQGVFTKPGETFDAGSGYFLDPEHVVTAGHVPRMVAEEAKRSGVTFRRGVPQHFMEVHDPRADLHWFVYSISELAYKGEAAEFTILSVAPLFLTDDAAERYGRWRNEFGTRVVRVTPLTVGERLIMRGYTKIDGKLVSHGLQHHLEINGEASYGEAFVESIHDSGFLMVKTPCVVVRGAQMPGNTSGGPVVDSANNIVGVVTSSGSDPDTTVISAWSTILPQPPAELAMTALQVSDMAVRFGIV